jgi:RimJ/RimL family protein N-acetyltransferase
VITTDRLHLRPFTLELATAVVAGDREGRNWIDGFPREDDQDGARMFIDHPSYTFPSYAIELQSTGETIGSIGFFGPPDEHGTVMLGYGLAEQARGFGYATEALRGLIVYAFSHPEVTQIVADTDLDNVASHRVLEKTGFVRTHSTDTAHWYGLNRA